jgi:hypothetical protein
MTDFMLEAARSWPEQFSSESPANPHAFPEHPEPPRRDGWNLLLSEITKIPVRILRAMS